MSTPSAAGAVVSLLLGACSSGGSDAGAEGETNASAGALNIGGFADVTSWDPALADIGFGGPFLSAIYDPLLALDADGNPIPALAIEWEVSDDFLTQRDDTILYLMGLGRSYMMAPDAIDAGTLSETPVGSGPYTMDDSTIMGTEYHFNKVADHWAADQFAFYPVSIFAIPDGTARTNAMLAGRINLNYADQEQIDAAPENGWNVEQKIAGWIGMQFTDRSGERFAPFGDEHVRQAMNFAYDAVGLNDVLAQGQAVLTNQVFPAGLPGNLPELDDRYTYDMAKAKELLAEAGYADGFDLTLPMMPVIKAYQPITDQVMKELGIRLTWDEMSYPDYAEKAASYPAIMGMVAIDSTPVANVERQIEMPQWYNPTPQADKFPEVQAAIDAVHAADPGDEQLAKIEELNRIVTDLAWWNIWFQSENAYVSTSNIKVDAVTGMIFPTLRHISPAA